MLNLFRQGGFMKAFLGVIVCLLIAAFAFDFRNGPTGVKQECVVRVNASCVDAKDLNVLTRLVGVPGMTAKAMRKTGFSQHAMNALVERELLLQEASRLGVGVSDDEIDNELFLGRVHFSWPADAPIPQALFQGMPFPKTGAQETLTYIPVRNSKTDEFDFKTYRRQVQNLMHMSPKEFKKLQRDEITAWRVRQMVTAPVRVSEEEAYFAFEQQSSKVTARFAEIHTDWFERFAVATDAAAVSAFEAANASEVTAAWDRVKDEWKEGCPLVSEIVFNYPAGADAEQRATTSEAAQRAVALLNVGTPFGVVARAQSESPDASLDGYLGCLTEKSSPVASDLLAAVAKLAVGQTSPIVETAKGLHVLRLDGKVGADAATVGKAYIARKLAQEAAAKTRAEAFAKQLIADVKAGELLTESVEKRRKEFVIGAKTDNDPVLLAALDSVDAPKVDISRPVPRGTPVVIGLKDVTVTNALFDLEDGALLREPQATHLGFVVLQLKEKDLATREAFAKDKADLVRNLTEQKRALVLTEYVASLRTKAKKIEYDQRYLRDEDEKKDGKSAQDNANDNG